MLRQKTKKSLETSLNKLKQLKYNPDQFVEALNTYTKQKPNLGTQKTILVAWNSFVRKITIGNILSVLNFFCVSYLCYLNGVPLFYSNAEKDEKYCTKRITFRHK